MQTRLTPELKSQIESLGRIKMAPDEICDRLNLDPVDDLGMIRRVCEQASGRFVVGLQCVADRPQPMRQNRVRSGG
jgi:hypothetical protein